MLVDDARLSRQGESTVSLQMQFSLFGTHLPKDYVTELVPRLFTPTDSVDFPTVRLYGRQAYYHRIRNAEPTDTSKMEFRVRDAYQARTYARSLAYQPWMQAAQLKFVVRTVDGCGVERDHNEQTCLLPLTEVAPPPANTGYGVTTTQKTQQLQGRAYISFPVNRTEINPNYQDNARELERIHHSIDSLLRQENVVMQHLTLKGFASPEGNYVGNIRLASGRVHSLKQYLIDTYGLDRDIISVDFEPEDWEGLRQYVDASRLPERKELLALIDAPGDPDEKLSAIMKAHPTAYQYLLDSVFVYLRHTDYRIDYMKMWEEREVTGQPTDAETSTPPSSTATALAEAPQPEPTTSHLPTYRPRVALKTNLLFDALLAPNIELEVPLGRKQRWSVMAETWCPWVRYDGNSQGKHHQYYRSDQRPTRRAYQIWTLGAEVRYWLWPRCDGSRPWLCGTFLGLYGAGGLYDVEWDSVGDQGEFTSFGISAGHSWAIGRRLNLEVSGAVGYVGGPRRHYEAEFQDTHLIFRHYANLRYFGPTKLKVSLVWLIGKKGGAR